MDKHRIWDIMSPLQGYRINNELSDRAYALSYALSPLRGLTCETWNPLFISVGSVICELSREHRVEDVEDGFRDYENIKMQKWK